MKYHLIWPKLGVDKRHVMAYGHGRWKPSFASRFDLAFATSLANALPCDFAAVVSQRCHEALERDSIQ